MIDNELINDRVKETLDRVRRFETRFTRYLANRKFDTKTEPPVWKDGVVEIPSMECSIASILEAIPESHVETDVEIYHKGNSVCWLSTEDPNADIPLDEIDRYGQG